MTTTTHETEQYKKAAGLLKTQAIIAIVFGGLGVLIGFILTVIFIAASGFSETEYQAVELIIYAVLTPLFIIVPYIYLLISGILLLRNPTPKLAKVLSIINIVFGALWNLVVLIFAVLYVAQSADYERGYKHTKK
ncbi:MAG: hypothetical protein WAQ27_02320 [Candidatus Microsaccharimonas sp.]